MNKLYNPGDRNLAVNPHLAKANSPWRFWLSLVLCAIALDVLWTYFSPDIRLTRPALVFSTGQITATTQATNRTASPVTLSIRIIVGMKGNDTEFGSGQFYPLGERDVLATIPARSTLPVSCVFPLRGGRVPRYAEARLLSRR